MVFIILGLAIPHFFGFIVLGAGLWRFINRIFRENKETEIGEQTEKIKVEETEKNKNGRRLSSN